MVKAELDYDFGQPLYLKNDANQNEYLLTRIFLLPKKNIVLELLSPDGEYIEVWEGIVSKQKDTLKMLMDSNGDQE